MIGPVTVYAGSRILAQELFTSVSLTYADGSASMLLTARDRHLRTLAPLFDRDAAVTVMADITPCSTYGRISPALASRIGPSAT